MSFETPETPQKEAFAQMDAFIEAGGNLLDTADVHNGGVAEETVPRPSASSCRPTPASRPRRPDADQ